MVQRVDTDNRTGQQDGAPAGEPDTPPVVLRVAVAELGASRSSVDLAGRSVVVSSLLDDRQRHEQLLACLGHLYARNPRYLRP